MTQEEFTNFVREIGQMHEIKSVAWEVSGENPQFDAEKTLCRIEDTDGNTVKIPIVHYSVDKLAATSAEVLVNVLMAKTTGEVNVTEHDISAMINELRKRFKAEFEKIPSASRNSPTFIF